MQKDKVQRLQGIGLFFAGLGSIVVVGTYARGLSVFTVMGVILFLIGAFYFGKSVVIRRKITNINT